MLWTPTPTADIKATDARSPTAMFVPVTAETPQYGEALAYLKSTGSDIPSGQKYCLNFDYALTDPSIAWLSLVYYWLNEKGEYYNRAIWTNTAETDTGRWETTHVFIDGEADWKVKLNFVDPKIK